MVESIWWSLYSLNRGWLTHWGRVTHICVGNPTIIGSDNGLSPDQRQAIIRTNAGILLIRPLGTNFSEILIEILIFSFKKMRSKVLSAKRRPFCIGLNVLRTRGCCTFGTWLMTNDTISVTINANFSESLVDIQYSFEVNQFSTRCVSNIIHYHCAHRKDLQAWSLCVTGSIEWFSLVYEQLPRIQSVTLKLVVQVPHLYNWYYIIMISVIIHVAL